MSKISLDVDNLSQEQTKSILKHIVEKLDELDCEDYFGSEGWKHLFNL
jgi:hypothetical protein